MGRQEKERLAPRSDRLVQEPNGIEQMGSVQFHLERETEWPMARPVNQPQNLQQALRTPSEERHKSEPIGRFSQSPSFDAHFMQANQNLINSLQGGAAKPSTFEFQRTAADADAAERHVIRAQPDITLHSQVYGLDVKPPSSQYDERIEANGAVNGLYLLAQTQTPHKNGVQQSTQARFSPPHRAFAMPSQLLPASAANLTSPKLNSEYYNNNLHSLPWSNIHSRSLSNSNTIPRNQNSQSHIGVETYDPRLHLLSSAPGILSNNRKILTTGQPYEQFGRVNPLKEERDIDRSNNNPESHSPLTFVPSAPLEEAPFPPERNPTAEHEILTLDRSREHVRLLNEGLSPFPVNMGSETRPHNNVSQSEPWKPIKATGTESNPSTASNLYLTTTESAPDKFYANPSYESPKLPFSALSYNSILSGPSAASSAMGSPHSIQDCIAPASEWRIHSLELDSNPRASSTFQSSSSSLRPQVPQPLPPPHPFASLSSPSAHHPRRHGPAVQGWQKNSSSFSSSLSSSAWQSSSKRDQISTLTSERRQQL
jgi:hypothetical protein